jgi:hypothetical protein
MGSEGTALHAIAPAFFKFAISLSPKPQSTSASAVLAPGAGGGFWTAPGVRAKRGAGPGWVTPATSMKVPRAALWGCFGASASERTGAKHASLPSRMRHHSSRVRALMAAANLALVSGHFSVSYCFGRLAGSRPSFARNSA